MTDIAHTPELHSVAPISAPPVDARLPITYAPAPALPTQLTVHADEYVVGLDNGRYLTADGRETVTELDSAQVFRKRSAVASAVRSYRRGAKRLGFDPAVVNVLHRQKLVTQFVTYAGEIHLDSH